MAKLGKELISRAEKLRKLFRYLRNGDLMPLYHYFLIKVIWPLFHRELTLKNAVKVMKENWDYLIVLDACRYETFNKIVDDNAGYVISGDTNTRKWMRWNFSGKYRDVIYIASNPYLSSTNLKKSLGFNPFYMVQEVWDYGWDSVLKTVPPEQVTNAALETLQTFPDKRMIIHYLQPHHPYIADRELLEASEGTSHAPRNILWGGLQPTTLNPLQLAKQGKIPLERVKKAYEENLRIVMKEVRRLSDELAGRVVLTADHGEAFGEYGIYGHGSALRVEALVKVPWVILKDEARRLAYEKPNVEKRRVTAKIMQLKDSGIL